MQFIRDIGRHARKAGRAGIAVLVTALALAACDIGDITETGEGASWRSAPPAGWDEVLAHPVPLEVVAYVTGEVLAGDGILIDADKPGVPARYREDIWVPSVAYLVRHPSGRTLLMDAGLRAGPCGYRVLLLIEIGCRNQPGADALSRLAADGVHRLDHLLVSHFHGDHVSGLAALLKAHDPLVLTTHGEIDAVRSPLRELSGYKRDQLTGGMKVVPADAAWLDMPHLGKVADLYGDGSVWLLSTPGHTPGHLSALLNLPGGPLLFTFDAAHLQATFAHVAPGGLWWDPELGARSIERLRAFAEAYPQTRIIYGHEPAQWAGKGPRVVLAGNEE